MLKKIIALSIVLFFISSCDDGDFNVPSFVFGTDVENCGDLILFNISDDNKEALIFSLNEDNESDNNAFFKTPMTDVVFDLNEISYRIFSGNISGSYFCQSIPPSTPNIIEEWNGNGTLIVNNQIILDDNDGVEELDLTIDSDNDGVFDYIDLDDDNDGILTIDELVANGQSIDELVDADGDNTLDYLDTDGDLIFDYLDTDDDDDGTPTINELLTDSGGTSNAVDYLDNSFSTIQTARSQIDNKYTLSYITQFTIENMSLLNNNGNVINYESYEYGVKTGNIIVTD